MIEGSDWELSMLLDDPNDWEKSSLEERVTYLEYVDKRRRETGWGSSLGIWLAKRVALLEKNLTDTQETCTRQLLENRKQREDAARTEASMRAILAAREGETSWQAACRVMVELAEVRAAKELAESNAGHDHDEAVQLKTENHYLREQLGSAKAHVRTLIAKLDEPGGM